MALSFGSTFSQLCTLAQNVRFLDTRQNLTVRSEEVLSWNLVYELDVKYGIEVWHMMAVTFGVAIIVWAFFHFIVRPKQIKVLDDIRNKRRQKTEGMGAKILWIDRSLTHESQSYHIKGCLDRLEKKLGWDAETRRQKKLDKEMELQ